MPDDRDTLAALRREIDRIDDAIHDLLMQRTATVERVREAKSGDGSFLRPGREAEVLRRLTGRHDGAFPVNALVRIWREIMSAQVRVQGPFSIAVYTPKERSAYWDLARDHFGGTTPITAFQSMSGVLRAVGDRDASVGVLPLPSENEEEPWWPSLAAQGSNGYRIIARLPFIETGWLPGGGGGALAIAPVEQEPTGNDHTFLALEVDTGTSRDTIKAVLDAADLRSIFIAREAPTGEATTTLCLVEVEIYVAPGDGRLEALVEADASPVRRAVTVGGFAVPLAPVGGSS